MKIVHVTLREFFSWAFKKLKLRQLREAKKQYFYWFYQHVGVSALFP